MRPSRMWIALLSLTALMFFKVNSANSDPIKYNEPPDLRNSAYFPTQLGVLDVGTNTVSGHIAEAGADGHGDYMDAFILRLRSGQTITSVTFSVPNVLGSTPRGGVMMFFGGSGIANETFNTSAIKRLLSTPITGPGSVQFQTGEVGSTLPLSVYPYHWTITVVAGNDSPNCFSSDPLFFEKSVSFRPLQGNGSVIVGEFSPVNGCTLDDVAAAFGFDHFAWINLAIEFPSAYIFGLATPFFDPPYGGYPGSYADSLPFYWDEGNDPNIDPAHHINAHIAADRKSLGFLDSPENYLLLPGQKMTFRTLLVGVYPNMDYDVLTVTEWSSNYTGTRGRILPGTADIPPDWTAGQGGIFNICAISLGDLSSSERQILIHTGAQNLPSDDDLDSDGVPDAIDNCLQIPNADQIDTDGDGQGDVCDPDDDNDGILDEEDNCPATFNPSQEDLDGDGIGDKCDADIDGDGVHNEADNCPLHYNPGQDDADGDGAGDACDADDDNDGISDLNDNCVLLANPDQADCDGDGIGNACDSDSDGDNVDNDIDNCPSVPNPNQSDFDGDGQGDACDADIDDDGVDNEVDVCGLTPLGAVVAPGSGCSIAQLCPCEGPRGTTMHWKNHGEYVSCVAKSAGRFVTQGLIMETEKAALVSVAAQSACGRK